MFLIQIVSRDFRVLQIQKLKLKKFSCSDYDTPVLNWSGTTWWWTNELSHSITAGEQDESHCVRLCWITVSRMVVSGVECGSVWWESVASCWYWPASAPLARHTDTQSVLWTRERSVLCSASHTLTTRTLHSLLKWEFSHQNINFGKIANLVN